LRLDLLWLTVGMTLRVLSPDSSHLLTAVLRAFALVGPPKTRFSLVVSLGEVGLITHQVPNEVSALSTFDFPFIQTLPGAMRFRAGTA
jgi:hypothetical protein